MSCAPSRFSRADTAWLDRLTTEHDNLRAALRWSQDAPDGGPEGLRLAGALSRFWVLRGYLSEGRAWVAVRTNPLQTMSWRIGATAPRPKWRLRSASTTAI